MGRFLDIKFISILLIFSLSEIFPSYLQNREKEKLFQPNKFAPNQVLLKFNDNLSPEERNRLTRRANAKILSEISSIGVIILSVPDGEIENTIANLRQLEGVVYVEPNYYVSGTEIFPNDPGWGNQYNMNAIRAPAGWELNTGAVWVTIAIVDTGVDLLHPDLFVRILPGYDFVNSDSDPQDDNGHGTHVAAIAAASTNNGEGVAGVNWGANILPIKVLNSSATGTYANVSAGIVWATDHGAQVINLSLGGPSPSFVLNDAVNYAYQRGVILVASTGNAGAPAVLYPAAYDPVIAVGATDSGNNWAGFSNYGPELDVVAPGVDIYSAFPGGGYGYRSGTSMAAPHVSGLAALLWGIPGNGPARIRTLIESSALDLGASGWDEYFGSGLIQMDAAILRALPTATPESTMTSTTIVTPTGTMPISNGFTTATAGKLFLGATLSSLPPPTPDQTITITPMINQTPVIIASEISVPAPLSTNTTISTGQLIVAGEVSNNNWLGCAGAGFIVLGFFLFWLGYKNREKRYRSVRK